jgi:hypothetical protein
LNYQSKTEEYRRSTSKPCNRIKEKVINQGKVSYSFVYLYHEVSRKSQLDIILRYQILVYF